jgi:quercetin dioxygenase-like cupin family protein
MNIVQNQKKFKIPLLQHSDGEWIEAIPGERIRIRISNKDVKGRYGIMESVAGPGSAAPMHTHLEDEIFHVLEGTPTFALDEKVFDASPGEMIVVPAGVPHAWKNRTQADVRLVATFVPGGVEELFTKLAGLSPDQIGKLAAQYGTIIVGPPLAD